MWSLIWMMLLPNPRTPLWHQEAAGAYHQGAWGPDQDQLSADILVHMFT